MLGASSAIASRSYAAVGALLALSAFGCSSDDSSGGSPGGSAGSGGSTGSGGATGSGGSSGSSGSTASGGASSGGATGTGGGAGATGACANIQAEGHKVGQIAENWTLKDRNGANVNLHDYCGQVIYIEDGAEW